MLITVESFSMHHGSESFIFSTTFASIFPLPTLLISVDHGFHQSFFLFLFSMPSLRWPNMSAFIIPKLRTPIEYKSISSKFLRYGLVFHQLLFYLVHIQHLNDFMFLFFFNEFVLVKKFLVYAFSNFLKIILPT